MANTLQYTSNFVTPFCRYMSPSVGTSLMPLVGISSLVRNIILAAPFTWRFNRANVNLTVQTSTGQQDYSQSIPDLGFLEKATAYDNTSSANDTWEFNSIKNNEALAAMTGGPNNAKLARPMSISVFSSDGNGNYTFRLSPVPDKAYTINLVYQKASVQFAALTDGWAPIPDTFSDVYNNLCLGYYMDSCQDPRAPQYIARGIAGLLARADGLKATDKAIFAASYMNLQSAMVQEQLKTQQGVQAQGAR